MALPRCFEGRLRCFAPLPCAGPQALALGFAFLWLFAIIARAGDLAEARAWYKTLGYPDATKTPYVRVATGRWMSTNGQARQNRYVEGFLVSEEPAAFTVFICSISHFENWAELNEPYPTLTTVRFIRRSDGPVAERVEFEKLDLAESATAALARVRKLATSREGFHLRFGHCARIFAFAQACRQRGFAEIAAALEEQAVAIPDEQTGKKQPEMIREALQREIGDAILSDAEQKFSNVSIPWSELVKPFEKFAERYPANKQIAHAEETEALLRKESAEEAEHHPKPYAEMTKAEQIAEDIFQLRNLQVFHWVQGRYPVMAMTRDPENTEPVRRLVDFGDAAFPALIEALDDRCFTRSAVQQSMSVFPPPPPTRVCEVAQQILQNASGENFFPHRNEQGELDPRTVRQQAEKWWAKMKSTGERQRLIEVTASGAEAASSAAHILVAKYPDAALAAFEKGVRVTQSSGVRRELIELAGKLPAKEATAFLKGQFASSHDLYTRVCAARALQAFADPAAVPGMIAAWQKLQPRLPKNEGAAYFEAGQLIGFLADSGDVRAIDALRLAAEKAPVDVQLAVVEVFLRRSKTAGTPDPGSSSGSSATGDDVHADSEMNPLPGGEAGRAIDRLLVAALDQTAQRPGLEGHIGSTAYKDPRVCDFAAFVLARRWPEKIKFVWSGTVNERDAQIIAMRDWWRTEAPAAK